MNGRRSIEDVKGRLDRHILPVFGERRASAINTADIRVFAAKRQEAGASNGEINRELTAIKRAFSVAVQAGKLATKPYIPMLKENNTRTGFFERDQFEAVRRHLPESVQGVASFAYITGWRVRSETLPLHWRQVDLKAGTVRLEPGTTKNDEARVFPLTADLRAVLEVQKARSDALRRDRALISPFVFFWFGKRTGKRVGTGSSRFADPEPPRALRREPQDAFLTIFVVPPYATSSAGVPERVAMKLTGHKTRSVFERYNIVNDADLTEAARRLDAFMGTIAGIVTNLAASQPPVRPVESIRAPVAQVDRATVS